MSLPDEIIKEILSPALQVSDEDFSSTTFVSPFNKFTESTSACLVIRGYGDPIAKIFACAPNVTDIWLTLKYVTNESVSGLCKGLPKMNPRRVIFCDPDFLEVWGNLVGPKDNWNKPVRDFLGVLPLCFSLWNSLEILEIPYRDNDRSPKSEALYNAILRSNSLKILVLSQPQLDIDFLSDLVEFGLRISLTEIRIVFKPTGDANEDTIILRETKQLEARMQAHSGFFLLVKFQYPDTDNVIGTDNAKVISSGPPSETAHLIPRKDPSFVPLKGVPSELQEKIWSRVLYFAMFIDEEKVNRLTEPKDDSDRKSPRIDDSEQTTQVNYLLVSKMFNNLGRPFSFRCLILTSQQLQKLVNIFEKEPLLAIHVRSIYTFFSYDGGRLTHLVSAILSRVHRLVRFISPTGISTTYSRVERQREGAFTYKAFETLASTAGSTLLGLSGQPVHSTGPPKPATSIFAFVALRYLEWNTPLRLSYEPKDVPRDALPNLETLVYCAYTSSFLDLLGCMDLPSLRHVEFLRFMKNQKMEGSDEFLQRHGSKFLTLDIDTANGVFKSCPSLQSLCVTGSANAASFIHAHSHLTKISFTREVTLGQIKTAYKLFGEVDSGLFLALKEVKVDTIEWPSNEREITKGYKATWVTWSERLLQWNVKLIDREGRQWRPRLK